MVVEALYAHGPWNLKVSNSTNYRPPTRLNYAIWRGIYGEGILFSLARDSSAVHASSFSDNAVENENRYSASLSLDYIPNLSNSACRVANSGKRKRKMEFGLRERAETPKVWSAGTDVLETPSRSQASHRPCAKHIEDADHPKDQRQQDNCGKELE